MKWFKHDSDANRDPKLEKVLMRYGAEGYALYWLCIELIAAPIDKNNLNFDLEHDAEILAHRLKMDSVVVEKIMRFMVNLGLFEIDATTQRITCLKLANRIENSIIKNPELKQIQQLISDHPGQSRTIPDNLGKVRPDTDKTRSEEIRSERARKRAPADFTVIVEMYEWAEATLGLQASTVQFETEKFMDHEFKNAKKDWPATWRNWMRAAKDMPSAQGTRKTRFEELFPEESDAAQA